MTTEPQMTNDDPLLAACRESWNAGFQTCIDALKDLAPDYSDESAKRLIGELAETLEALKPSDESFKAAGVLH